ncbi:hypothetical protein Tco_0665626 [Tanacetum coccineum]
MTTEASVVPIGCLRDNVNSFNGGHINLDDQITFTSGRSFPSMAKGARQRSALGTCADLAELELLTKSLLRVSYTALPKTEVIDNIYQSFNGH